MYRFTALTQTHGGVQILNTHITLDSSASTSTRIFRIPALRMDDTGTYKCSVENGVVDVSGQLYQTAETNLMVKVSPKVLTPSLKVAAATGANASLSIPVYAYPTLDKIVLQRYDGLNISSSSGKHILLPYNTNVTANWYGTKVQVDGTLLNFTIINLEPVDFGNYTLNMKNAFSVSSAVLTVVAESKPSSPAALNFTVIQKSVYFAWKRGFNGGHPQTFVIQLSKDSSDNYINHTTVIEEASIGPDDTVTFNITSLDVGFYYARLLTFNAIGAADPVMFGVFRIAKESKEEPPASAALIGGVVGGGAAVIIVAVILFILWKKRRLTGSKSDGDQLTHGQKMDKISNSKKRKKAEVDSTGDVEVENMMYIPASDISRGGSPSDVLYTTVNKPKPTVASSDVYAVVNKKEIKKNKKGKKNASIDDGDIYENSAPGQRMKAQDNKGFVPENNSPKLPKKTLNHDGLEYAELEFVNPPKGQKRLVIHGLDNMTEYAEVDLTKKADPLPDSDTEEKKKE
ncbi:nephrin-like [Dreissena polymorpha]|uniref:nephrin-like n=1 Tax=Dreissena polymorpha TaxID=45954 RepID=UPI002263BE03|nr:nephrin-like [Dreissena polymorpha]